MCNPWEYFVTLTIDPAKYDRYNLKEFHKHNAQFVRDYNKKHGAKIKYLIIPEQHKDGAWHEHGLFLGIPQSHLTAFTLDQKLPHKIRKKLKKGDRSTTGKHTPRSSVSARWSLSATMKP